MHLRWGSLIGTMSGSISLRPGVDFDTFQIGVAGRPEIPRDADLVFGDEIVEITLLDCRMLDGSLVQDPVSLDYYFTAMDFRWKWTKAEPINGEYNRRDENDNIVGTKKTARELAALLAEKLPTPAAVFDVSQMTAEAYPYVNWDYARPADELQLLCDEYSIAICPREDSSINLFENGTGVIDPGLATKSDDLSTFVVTLPEKVIFVSSPNLYQIELDLTAVAYDPDDNVWREVGDVELPYWPPGGWPPLFEDSFLDDAHRKAARETVFIAYRLPDTIQIGAVDYSRAEAMRRWQSQLVEYETIDNATAIEEKRYKNAFIKGRHSTLSALSDPNAVITEENTIVPVPFSIDDRRGLIFFSKQVFDLDLVTYGAFSPVMIGADLKLTCAFEGDTYKKEYGVPGGVSGLRDIMRAFGIRLNYIWSDDAGGAYIVQNLEEADAEADKFVNDAWEKQYSRATIQARTHIYPGIHNLFPDGQIDHVSWALSGQGQGRLDTTVSWSMEHDPKIQPKSLRKGYRIISDVARIVKTINRSRVPKPTASALNLIIR